MINCDQVCLHRVIIKDRFMLRNMVGYQSGMLYVAVLALAVCVGQVQCLPNVTVSVPRLKGHLLDAFSQPRHSEGSNKDIVRNYIRDYYKEVQGQEQEVIEQNFTYSVQDEGKNIIVFEKGTEYGKSTDKPILLGAHYDSVEGTSGVDDNGSGMATLLECMQAVHSVDPEDRLYTVIFVAFDEEEDGLRGSEAFIRDYLVPQFLEVDPGIPAENFQGAIILDTILNYDNTAQSQIIPNEDSFSQLFPELVQSVRTNEYRGDFLTVIGRQSDEALSDLLRGEWKETTEKAGTGQLNIYPLTIPIEGRPSVDLLDNPILYNVVKDAFRSDHWEFWEYDGAYTDKGLKAIFLTDTANFRGTMEQCYHQACDDKSMITDSNLQFLATTTATIAEVLIQKATGLDDVDVTIVTSGSAAHHTTGSLLLLMAVSVFITGL